VAGVNGPALGAVLAGSVFVYAGLTGKSVLKSIQAVVSGKSPGSTGQANPISGNPGGSGAGLPSGTSAIEGTGAEATLKATAAEFGWTGAEWTALYNVEMAEAGFSATAKNASSGALGLAQALGHGTGSTAGSLGNEYGGFGLTDAQARAANSGDAGAQSLWMCGYIKATYGTPSAAWAHEQANHWY
jgi:hypothetical protein